MVVAPLSDAAAASNSKAVQSSRTLADSFDNFLTLLTVQLQNQDPLEPIDTNEFTNQLVAFTEVEQSVNTNGNLEDLINLIKSNELSASVGYIGKQIESAGVQAPLENGQAKWSYTLDAEAKDVSVKVLDKDGKAVFTKAGETGKATHAFAWDGKDKDGKVQPDGLYTLAVTAKNKDGESIDVGTTMFGTADGILTENGVNMLDVGGVKVPLSAVISARSAATGSSTQG